MTKPVQIALCTMLLTLAACAVFVSWRLARMLQSVDDTAVSIGSSVSGADLAATTSRMNATLDAINAPCIGFHGSVTCGPLAQLSQTEKNIGIVAAQSALQVRQTGELITASAQTVKDVSVHLSRTADAATGTLNAASDTLGEGKRTLSAVQPVLASIKRDSDSLNELLKDHAIHDTLTNVQFLTQNAAGVTYDLKRISDKTADDYTKRKTPWMRIGTTTLDLIHLGAWAAR